MAEPPVNAAGTPRWVNVAALLALVLVVLLVVMMAAGGGHGPGRHLGGGDDRSAGGGDNAGDRAAPSDVPEGHEPPSWVPEH
jgi:hypothetical protein